MAEKGFKKLFWGYVFLLISVRIKGVDILPDFIGYIIILLGLKDLVSNSEHLIKAMKYSYPLIILSLVWVYQTPTQQGFQGFPSFNLINISTEIIITIISLLFMYNLLMGVKEICNQRQVIDLYNKSNDLWSYYWKLSVALLIAIPIIFIPIIGIIYGLIVIISIIVVEIRIVKLFWDCSIRFNIDNAIS